MIWFIGASLQLHLVTSQTALSLIYTLSNLPLHTHKDSQSPLVVPVLLCYLPTNCNIRPQKAQLPLLRVGTCLRSRCLAMRHDIIPNRTRYNIPKWKLLTVATRRPVVLKGRSQESKHNLEISVETEFSGQFAQPLESKDCCVKSPHTVGLFLSKQGRGKSRGTWNYGIAVEEWRHGRLAVGGMKGGGYRTDTGNCWANRT
jgi:hypothetical protein